MRIIAVIPARLASVRLPEKPLKEIGGVPLIVRVMDNVRRCRMIDRVIVATDSDRIVQAVEQYGGIAEMTSERHESGTDRVNEVAGRNPAEIYVNVQGDEPFISPEYIEEALNPFIEHDFKGISTLCTRIDDNSDIDNPNVVKVVRDSTDNALYFSRSAIPYYREKSPDLKYYRHIGLYVYDSASIKRFTEIPQCDPEKAERLEQLRALYNGIKIKVIESDYKGIGIDTIEDLEKARKFIEDPAVPSS
ncbi:MAG: 3-deoxy-manno-octulosonate cytidylyltransferase [Candidatus Muiribacteriaceae bacterium]